jgi:Icc protein
MRIAHLSDPHLARGPLAAQPAANLADAIGRVLAIEPRPDCIVITGDLADTGHPEEYATLHALLRRCPVPVHLMPGNHDDPDALIARFGDTPFLDDGLSTKYAVEYPEATVIVADSWMPQDPAGELGPDQLAWIDRTLTARPQVPAVVCLHHPPLALGMPFLDSIMLTDAAASSGCSPGTCTGPSRRCSPAPWWRSRRARSGRARCGCTTRNCRATCPSRRASCCTCSMARTA